MDQDDLPKDPMTAGEALLVIALLVFGGLCTIGGIAFVLGYFFGGR